MKKFIEEFKPSPCGAMCWIWPWACHRRRFGKITSSLVDNIIMPPLSLLFGKVDFSGLFISLNGQHYDTLKAAQDAHAPILAYGLFINTIVNFLIIALLFLY
mgnify:CR=1 FL=1